ncbi:MAG TPA: DUF58 domain-containing protein [Candidatus Acidoferrales bacterium]|nr:DUF58 domain-containing protein [Candidatus Acidoferrales bacterium]
MEPGASVTDATAALSAVLKPSFLRKLDRLHLTVRRSLSTRPGNTPMPRGAQGFGIELESYKAYGAGDDLRHLDWNAYGRLDQLLIKTFRAEREAPLHIFVDTSASMAAPVADGKLAFTMGLAASLSYVSLRNHDPVRVVGLNESFPGAHVASPFFRHRQALHGLCDFLRQLQPRGHTALAAGIAAALRAHRSPGVAIVLSDFLMEPSGYESALSDLIARRFTVGAVRVLGPGERDPAALFRRGQLLDVETGKRRFITLSRENISRYREALTAHLRGLQTFCNRCGIVFSVADTGAGLEHSLFHDLPAVGLVH